MKRGNAVRIRVFQIANFVFAILFSFAIASVFIKSFQMSRLLLAIVFAVVLVGGFSLLKKPENKLTISFWELQQLFLWHSFFAPIFCMHRPFMIWITWILLLKGFVWPVIVPIFIKICRSGISIILQSIPIIMLCWFGWWWSIGFPTHWLEPCQLQCRFFSM